MDCLGFNLEGGEVLSRGAEAVLYKFEDKVVKFRPHKSFRIPEIDNPIVKYRTRREARIILKLNRAGFPCPRLFDVDETSGCIVMAFVDGDKLKNVLNDDNYVSFMNEAGSLIAKLHSLNIIHNDLTTSNFIFSGGKLYLIDFGLSFISQKVEDKAVDIHLFKRALESKHSKFWEDAFKVFLESYKKCFEEAGAVVKRLNEKVELRGRYKRKNR